MAIERPASRLVKIVRSIQINPDSVEIAYMDEGDVRLGGDVFQSHHMSVNRGSNFDDEIGSLEAAAEALVTDVLIDYDASSAFDMVAGWQEDDDDEEEDDG